MGKITYRGLVPKDDPMFSGGLEMFSRPAPRNPPAATPAEPSKAVTSPSADDSPEDQDSKIGQKRVARFKHQNKGDQGQKT